LISQESLKKLVETSEHLKRNAVPLNMVKDLLTSSSTEVAEEIIAQGFSTGNLFFGILMSR
jgi:hypothetical protein